jgi:hypothetical protein
MRQNAGSVTTGAVGVAAPEAGGAKVPASTARATVIVVSGSFNDPNASHEAPALPA